MKNMTSTFVQMSFLSDRLLPVLFCPLDTLWTSTLLAFSVLPAQSTLKMNEDVITVICFKSLLATISFYDLTPER